MKKLFIHLLLVACLLSLVSGVHADYVLPYPSYMPGNKIYRISRIIDQLKRFWYFGNIAQLKYRQSLGDKYLVEAKTLFEYKQYLLATDALIRSDSQVSDIISYIEKAQKQGIDTNALKKNVAEEMAVHLSVLSVMESQLPAEFVWKPEKAKSTNLQIGAMLEHSRTLRQQIYNEIR